MLRSLFLSLAFLIASFPLLSQERDYGRSMVITRFGIVATSQTLASQAGADILSHGGNAVDAAIAANAVLGVTEPMMSGMGGDLFAIYYEARSAKLYGLNASGWTAKSLTLDYLKAHGIEQKIPSTSIHAVTVPGAVAGWDALHSRFGKLAFSEDLTPAIYYAAEGIPVTELVSKVWAHSGQALKDQAGFEKTFLLSAGAPRTGELFRNPDLASSLRLVAENGRNGFYRGPLAKKLVAFLTEYGSLLREPDFADFEPEWVEPISTTYRGWSVYELPPNGQGIAALSMLNIMEQFPLSQYGHNSVKALHIMIEAKKQAYADLAKYVGDPRFSKIPVDQLLSKDLARKRAALIDLQHAACHVNPSEVAEQMSAIGRDTTYLSVIDQDGNIVSLIQSNFSSFGTGYVAPGTGFALQNRGALFNLDPGTPDVIAPRKRPLHTIIPGFMKKGDVTMGFGIMGGFNQAQAHAQFVANVVDFGMNIQAALDAPRLTKLTFEGCDLDIESGVPPDVRTQLGLLGHQLKILNGYSMTMGRGNAVMLDGSGTKYGASDPRGDGEAIPQSPPWKLSK
jgi:gamma-glutamyltranspeptidase / glutathione hydrolase